VEEASDCVRRRRHTLHAVPRRTPVGLARGGDTTYAPMHIVFLLLGLHLCDACLLACMYVSACFFACMEHGERFDHRMLTNFNQTSMCFCTTPN